MALGGLQVGSDFRVQVQGEVCMQSNPTTESGKVLAAESPPTASVLGASQWGDHEPRADKATEASAPPPVWTRYIDSRLKQFCTR